MSDNLLIVNASTLARLSAELAAAKSRIGELEQALMRYGKHESDCHGWPAYREERCSCGFVKALHAGFKAVEKRLDAALTQEKP